jgi:3-keto-5-aminohexanoate cleavage enzyme
MGDSNRLIVNFTPTGMIPQKSQTPHVPILCGEIVEDVLKACEAGITMVHLHVRDEVTHQPSYRKELYARVIEGIRAVEPELVICVSTSGRVYNDLVRRSEVLELEGAVKPDMASLTLSSLNFNNQASVNEPSLISELARRMLERGIRPELEAFDSGMVNYAKYLMRKGLLQPPFYFNLILGNVACAQADLLHAGVLLNDLPDDAFASFGGVGNAQLPMNSLAVSMGYGVRVGLEDNIWYDPSRTRLATNLDLVRRIGVLASANEREIMPPSELRRLLKLRDGHAGYGIEGT